jgi:hypothetical protein
MQKELIEELHNMLLMNELDNNNSTSNTIDKSFQLVLINPKYTTNDVVIKRLVKDAEWKYNSLIINNLCYN